MREKDRYSGQQPIDHTVARSLNIADYQFSQLSDYVKYCTHRCLAKNEQEVLTNPDLVKYIQRHWHSEGQQGCVFARYIAIKAEQVGWHSQVIPLTLNELNTPKALADLNERLDNARNSPESENISFLFPQIRHDEEFARFNEVLTNLPVVSSQRSTYENMNIIKLRVKLKDEETESWLIGFGPFSFFPNTRRSPITELVMRTKPRPKDVFYKLSSNKKSAHVADIPTGLEDKVMDSMWQNTHVRRNRILNNLTTDMISAKITWIYPVSNPDAK